MVQMWILPGIIPVLPSSHSFGGQHSIQLSYERIVYLVQPGNTAP